MKRPELQRSFSGTSSSAAPRVARSVPRQQQGDKLTRLQQQLAPSPAAQKMMYQDLQSLAYKLHQERWKAGVRRHVELAGVSSQSACRSKQSAETSCCEGTLQLAWQSCSEGLQALAAPTLQPLSAAPAEEPDCKNSQGSQTTRSTGVPADVSIEDLENCSFASQLQRPHDSFQKDLSSEVPPELLLDFQKVSAHLEKAGELLNGLNAKVDKAPTRARKGWGGG